MIQGITVLGRGKIDDDFDNFLHKNDIEHVRIPLYAAFMGVAWERMIRTIKSSLSEVIGRKQIEYFAFLHYCLKFRIS